MDLRVPNLARLHQAGGRTIVRRLDPERRPSALGISNFFQELFFFLDLTNQIIDFFQTVVFFPPRLNLSIVSRSPNFQRRD